MLEQPLPQKTASTSTSVTEGMGHTSRANTAHRSSSECLMKYCFDSICLFSHITLQNWARPTTKEDVRSVKKQAGIYLTGPLLSLSRAVLCVKPGAIQLRILRVCLPQQQAPSPEQVVSWYRHTHPVGSPWSWWPGEPRLHSSTSGVPERAPPQNPHYKVQEQI